MIGGIGAFVSSAITLLVCHSLSCSSCTEKQYLLDIFPPFADARARVHCHCRKITRCEVHRSESASCRFQPASRFSKRSGHTHLSVFLLGTSFRTFRTLRLARVRPGGSVKRRTPRFARRQYPNACLASSRGRNAELRAVCL